MEWDTINKFTSSFTSTGSAEYAQAHIHNKIDDVHKSFLNLPLLLIF